MNFKADRFLASLMFIIAFWNASILILDLGIYHYAIGIIWVPLKFTLALGPCFYFYIQFITNYNQEKINRIWLHFVPVLFEIGLFFTEVYQGIPLRIGYYETPAFVFFDPIINFLAICSLLVYGIFAKNRIKDYHCWVKNNYSHYHRYNLKWLSRLSSIFLCLLIVWLCYFLVDYLVYGYKLTIYNYYPFHLTLAFISIWLSVEAFSFPGLVYPDKDLKPKKENNSTEEVEGMLKDKALWLTQKIEKNLLYLDPELSLKSLADTLNIHPNLTSKIINNGLEKTFSDCINEYRVKAVINKLKHFQEGKSTFLAIAFDCGFNSKTTFNRVFKKHVGVTPQQYLNSLK